MCVVGVVVNRLGKLSGTKAQISGHQVVVSQLPHGFVGVLDCQREHSEWVWLRRLLLMILSYLLGVAGSRWALTEEI